MAACEFIILDEATTEATTSILSLAPPEIMGRTMRCSDLIGRCWFLLVLALLADLAGVILIAVGIFANLSFWDFLIYTGASALALSVVFWIFWYTFNVEVSYEELGISPIILD